MDAQLASTWSLKDPRLILTVPRLFDSVVGVLFGARAKFTLILSLVLSWAGASPMSIRIGR